MSRKGPSPMKLKQEAARRRPYTPGQLLNYEPCPCDFRPSPSAATLDAAAEFSLSGGYKLRLRVKVRGQITFRSNVCPRCRLARSANKTCGCP